MSSGLTNFPVYESGSFCKLCLDKDTSAIIKTHTCIPMDFATNLRSAKYFHLSSSSSSEASASLSNAVTPS